jgi:structure-specific endonuclease subunit SLX1
MSSEYFVYFLALDNGKNTYIGATVDLDRRLRQHNKEISGGAHATGAKVAIGHTWKRVCYVNGFPTWQAALQFEWRWKQLTRQIKESMPPIDRRLEALNRLLMLDQSTTKAIPFDQWPSPPEVVFTDDEITH